MYFEKLMSRYSVVCAKGTRMLALVWLATPFACEGCGQPDYVSASIRLSLGNFFVCTKFGMSLKNAGSRHFNLFG